MEFIKNVFFFKIKSGGAFQLWAIFGRDLFIVGALEVLKFQFFKSFARGHHNIKRFFVSTKSFWRYFLGCIFPPKINNGIYKKCFFFQNKISWSISTMGHFWT